MHKNTNTLRALALGLAVVSLGTAASVHAAPSLRSAHVRVMSDSTVKDTVMKPDTTTKPDTTKPAPDTTTKH